MKLLGWTDVGSNLGSGLEQTEPSGRETGLAGL